MSAGMGAKLLVMAGGTGGHVYPALAVANALRDKGWSIDWVGTERGLEHRVVPANDIPLHCLAVRGLRGKGVVARLSGAARLLLAVVEAFGVVRRTQPDVVLGMGGYAAGPAGLAAWILRKPVVIHEQNAIAGTTNRLLAPLARRVLCGLPGAFSTNKATVVGNPVRADISALAQQTPTLPSTFTPERPLRLAILGGSLGSKPLNEALPAALATLDSDVRSRMVVRHQCGPQHQSATVALYAGCSDLAVEVQPYVEDMAAMYRWADVVVCRAGALTVAELAISGTPSVLVPLPHAIDDHQTANARALSSGGGAVLLPQAEMTTARLAQLLSDFVCAPQTLVSMGTKARRTAYPQATQTVAGVLQEVACVA